MDLLKWAGNKRWVLEKYNHALPAPETLVGYREPFLGTGAVAERYLGQIGRDGARLQCQLSDTNADLIAMYCAVCEKPEVVIGLLATYAFDDATYKAVRVLFNTHRITSPMLRAAWFIYLNKTCFNGLYRVNKRNEFNVPKGDYKNPAICEPDRIREASKILQHAHLNVFGYEAALVGVQCDEFVFLDPPYVPLSATANFTGYAADGFTAADQRALAEMLKRLDRVGCKFLLTNADTDETRELYRDWQIERVEVRRSVSAKKESRGTTGEILVTNYEWKAAA
jgi:DNA adenine methylase